MNLDITKEKPVVIIGAGIFGLTLANLLSEQKIPSVLIEKEDTHGGLARSFTHSNITFDIGPHRFHTTNHEVESFILRILGDRALRIGWKSYVYFMKKYFPWPLQPAILLRFPIDLQFHIFLDLLFRIYRQKNIETFEDYIINMYGPTIYHHFFHKYSEKFLGIPPSKTHPDWAKTGIDRAIIDNRLNIKSLSDLFTSTFLRFIKNKTYFIYPRGGLRVFCDRLAQKVSASGCEIISSTCPTRLDLTENSIESVRLSNGRIIKPSLLIWSGSVRDLAELLNIPYKNLDYLSIILYCCSLEKAPRHLFQWCYYGNYDIVFNRISNPSLFDPDLVPASRHALVAEVTCREGDSLWNNPGQIQSKILHDFTKVDLIEYPDLISSIYIHKIKDAYPIYSIDYKNSLTSFMNKLYDYKNLSIGGRTGRFWYNNMDHSIEDAIQVFKKITLQR